MLFALQNACATPGDSASPGAVNGSTPAAATVGAKSGRIFSPVVLIHGSHTKENCFACHGHWIIADQNGANIQDTAKLLRSGRVLSPTASPRRCHVLATSKSSDAALNHIKAVVASGLARWRAHFHTPIEIPAACHPQTAAIITTPLEPATCASPRKRSASSDTGPVRRARSHAQRSRLPESAVEYLRQWIRNNTAYPYPSEEQKRRMLADTDLLPHQLSNWLINARRRMLKAVSVQVEASETVPLALNSRTIKRFVLRNNAGH